MNKVRFRIEISSRVTSKNSGIHCFRVNKDNFSLHLIAISDPYHRLSSFLLQYTSSPFVKDFPSLLWILHFETCFIFSLDLQWRNSFLSACMIFKLSLATVDEETCSNGRRWFWKASGTIKMNPKLTCQKKMKKNLTKDSRISDEISIRIPLVGWLVGFYDISNFLAYLMPNPFYIYI